jgi:iron complex transport system permease protein
MQHKLVRFTITAAILTLLILMAMYFHLTSGVFNLTNEQVFKTLFGIESTPQSKLVIFDLRLPRIITAAIVGCGLALAGVVLQTLTKNPLADPGILGINSGAIFSVVLFMSIFQMKVVDAEISSFASVMLMPLFGFVGGLLAAGIILAISYNGRTLSMPKLILTGIAINSGFGALTLYFSLKMSEDDYQGAAIWMNGTIYNSNWYFICAMLPWVILFTVLVYRKRHVMDYFQLEESMMTSLGFKVEREKIFLLICSVGLVSACVSVSGSIGFIGLMAPHIARQLIAIHHRYVVPISMLIGAALLVFSDLIAKTLFSPIELSVGIVISIIGIPYFLFLLVKAKG